MIDVFVSVPYNHPQPERILERLELLEEYMLVLINRGLTPYSTILSMHELATKYNLRKDYGFWMDHCEKMINASACVHVLMLPGWRASEGVIDEIDLARIHNVPVIYKGDYYYR